MNVYFTKTAKREYESWEKPTKKPPHNEAAFDVLI
jgi:hypothetical protein